LCPPQLRQLDGLGFGQGLDPLAEGHAQRIQFVRLRRQALELVSWSECSCRFSHSFQDVVESIQIAVQPEA
jgi:hypothetical protein